MCSFRGAIYAFLSRSYYCLQYHFLSSPQSVFASLSFAHSIKGKAAVINFETPFHRLLYLNLTQADSSNITLSFPLRGAVVQVRSNGGPI